MERSSNKFFSQIAQKTVTYHLSYQFRQAKPAPDYSYAPPQAEQPPSRHINKNLDVYIFLIMNCK